MEESCSFAQVYPTPGLKAEPISQYQNQDDDDDCKLASLIKEDTTSDAENHSELSDDEDENESSYKTVPKNSTVALQKAKALIRKQQRMMRTFQQQIRRANEKISLQNKVLNDLMEIYGLKHEDIAVLKAEILRAEKLEANET